MHRRSMWTELACGGLGASLIVALGVLLAAPVRAAAECENPAAYVLPGDHLLGFKGTEATAFVSIMADHSLYPLPPEWDDAALVVAYVGKGDEVRVHFFDAMACDLGPWTSIPTAMLHFIDQHLGTPA